MTSLAFRTAGDRTDLRHIGDHSGASHPLSALTRRRRALLRLARRQGEVRLTVSRRGVVEPGAADVSELLDGLNEEGLLRFGGLRDGVLLYLAA